MNLKGTVTIDSGAAQKALVGLGVSAGQMASKFNAGAMAATEYAAVMPKLTAAIKNASAAESAAVLASARATKIGAETKFIIRKQEIATAEAAARAVVRAENDKQRAARETAKIAKAAATDLNPGIATKLPAGYLGSGGKNGIAGLGLLNTTLPDAGTLNQTRYALYDVATSLGVFGGALTAAGGASLLFSTQYESALAQVSRTTQLEKASVELASLQAELIDLSESIPVGFVDLASIASLGAQLNIDNASLGAFTETVAQFSAVTGVSTDKVAQDFGSLGELINVQASEYQNLGSAINFVGVNSVATDSEILNLATSIGASATQAGFLAYETVGLAGALASLRIQPEQARGVILRLFADFDRVVSQGGPKLQKYADVLGVTTTAAKALWETDAEGFFDTLLKGLSTADDLNATLTNLGITETRESNVLQRLAGNYDVYAQSIQNAEQSYNNGTFLGESYSKVAETVAARIEILVNTIQNLLAQAGESLLPILGPVIDVLTNILQAIEVIPAPILSVITATTLLAGGLLLVVAAGAALIASGFAVQTALKGITQQEGQVLTVSQGLRTVITQLTAAMGVNAAAAKIQSASIATIFPAATAAVAGTDRLTASNLLGASAATRMAVAARGVGAAFLSIPFVNVIAALSIVLPLVFSVSEGLENADKAAREAGAAFVTAGGGIDSLMSALARDTEAADNGASSLGQLTIKAAGLSEEQRAAAESAAAHATAIDAVTSASDTVATATAAVTANMKDQTYAIGQDTIAWFQNAAAKSEALKNLTPEDASFIEQTGFDFTEAAAAALRENGGATKYLEALKIPVEIDGLDAIVSIKDLVGPSADALRGLATELDGARIQMDSTNAIATVLGGSLGVLGTDADSASTAVLSMSDAVHTLFTQFGNEADFLDAMDALNASIEENGTSFDNLSQSGRANLAALETALASATTYGAQLGYSAEESIAQALYAVNGQAIDTSALLAQLASVPAEFKANLNIDDVIAKYNAISALGIGGGQLDLNAKRSEAARLAAQRAALAAQAGGSRSSGGGSAAKKAQSTLKTLTEYVNDLGSAMKSAFERRFGLPQAIDDVSSRLNSMSKAIQDAKNEARDLNTELNGLSADRAILQAQLFIAEDYGDTLRAAEIRAELEANQNTATDKTAQLAEANAAASAELNGNSKAAIDNRAAVLSLVGAYQAQIEAYAATGASAAQLAAYTATLQSQFQSQLVQMGYNANAVANYALVFNDLSAAIAAVPLNKEITVTASTAGASANIRNLAGQIALLDAQIAALNGDIDKAARAQPIIAKINALNTQLSALLAKSDGAGNMQIASIQNQINALRSQLTSGNYATGGVIGGVSRAPSKYRDNTMINAQLGEGVVNLNGMKYLGSDGLDALNQGQNPFGPNIVVAQGPATSGDMIVSLNQYERQLLIDIRNHIGTTLLGSTLQTVVNSENANSARRRTR